MKTVITKSEFARRKHRSPQAVTKWIKLGRISRAALVGEGNASRIWLERAEADLAGSLDPSQQLTQASPILSIDGETGPAASAETVPSPIPLDERALDLRRRAKADADRAEHDAEAARRKLAIDEGKYVIAEDAAREWARELARLTSEIETFLFSTLAREIADRHGLDWKPVAVQMREAFRKFRARISDDARRRKETVDDIIDDSDDLSTHRAITESASLSS